MKKAKEKEIKAVCPYCGSKDWSAGDGQTDSNEYELECECKCGEEFYIYYKAYEVAKKESKWL